MKHLGTFLKTGSLCFIATICCFQMGYAQHSKKAKDSVKTVAVQNMIETKAYVFKVQSATPMKGGTKQLTTEYTIRVSTDSLISDLPYFGRAYQATPGSAEGGIKFTSTSFDYATVNRKKGGWNITIKPKDVKSIQELILTVFDNGSASLNVNCNDRQPISYSGYIEELKQK